MGRIDEYAWRRNFLDRRRAAYCGARQDQSVRGGRTEWVDVKTGLASGPLVEVFGDLKPGDEIAARGTDELKAGASVQVKLAKAA